MEPYGAFATLILINFCRTVIHSGKSNVTVRHTTHKVVSRDSLHLLEHTFWHRWARSVELYCA